MAKKIEKLIYTNERGESITFSHASIFHTNEVSGLSDVRNEIYSINSMGQDGDTYLGTAFNPAKLRLSEVSGIGTRTECGITEGK